MTLHKKAETITEAAAHTDDLVILANSLTQAEYLLHSVEQAAKLIGLRGNAHKAAHVF